MNAIEENEFVKGWRDIGKTLPKPNAILCVSAHWETRGTFVTAMQKPMTIHDFGGFPQALFDVQYPASGRHRTALLLGSEGPGLSDEAIRACDALARIAMRKAGDGEGGGVDSLNVAVAAGIALYRLYSGSDR